jgi:hypothetical protein
MGMRLGEIEHADVQRIGLVQLYDGTAEEIT